MTTTTTRHVDGAIGDDEPVSYEVRDRVAIVTLNQPKSRNALSPLIFSALTVAMDRIASDGAKALVIAATGKSFCAGGDLAAVNDVIDGDVDVELGAIVDQLHTVIARLRHLPVPTIAAVDGAAIGAGVSLALATDVRVLGRSATFMTGYLAVGASPDGGASFHLARSLGTNQAVSGFLLNRRFSAADLLHVGLADAVVDDGAVDAAAIELAGQLTAVSPPALVAMRELVYAAPGRSFADHLDAEKAQFLAVARTEGFRRGVAPFARKQP